MIGKILKVIGFLVVACLVLGVIASLAQRGQPSTPANKSAENAQVKLVATVAPAAKAGEQAAAKAAPAEPTQAPEPTAAPKKLAGLGERVVSGGVALTIVSAERMGAIDRFLKPGEGMEFVVIEAVVENVDREKAPYNTMYFKVKDQDGYEYNATIAPDPSLKSGDLMQGDKARGKVAFEVKKGAAGLVVSYEPLVLFGGYETIRVALGQ